MSKKAILTSLFISSFGLALFGQVNPRYIQYNYNMGIINPAYTGSKDALSIGLLARKQWIKVEGAPQAATFFMHSPVGRSVGLGLSIVVDQIGPTQESKVFADFSYSVNLTEQDALYFGIKGGVSLLNREKLKYNASDPIQESVSYLSPNFGAGVYYRHLEQFYFGMSILNLLRTNYQEYNGFDSRMFTGNVNYLATGGYIFILSEQFKLKPSFMMLTTLSDPLAVDLSTSVIYRERFELGVSYSWDDSVSGIAAFSVSPSIRFGLSYGYTLSDLGAYNFGTVEAFLLIDIGRKSRTRFKSPRYFIQI